jgi:hypothetical protein
MVTTVLLVKVGECQVTAWSPWSHQCSASCGRGFRYQYIQYSIYLCVPERSLYAPYSFLLIPNKFWMGGGGGVRLCCLTVLVR